MKTFYKINVCFVFSLILNYLSCKLQSNFLDNFLNGNIIVIQITLMAITITTYTFLISKLEEISKEYPKIFSPVYRELKKTMYEQLICIGLSMTILIFKDSCIISNYLGENSIIIETLLTTCFMYSLEMLRDVGNSIFILIDAFQELKNK